MLGEFDGFVVLDEVQVLPGLFSILRVLADRSDSNARFIIIGSASPDIVRGVTQSLAGRVTFVDMAGFDLAEAGTDNLRMLWRRGGFPRSYLAPSETDSVNWRAAFFQTFLERDVPQLGITMPAPVMRHLWTALAHFHGQHWNASKVGRMINVSDKTARHYLDLLTGVFMVRQIHPWFEDAARRQVRAPKVYIRDTGLLHSLLGIGSDRDLLGHPCVGASWEGFTIEQVLGALREPYGWCWASHSGGALDLMVLARGLRIGFEMKFSEAPKITRTMRDTAEILGLDHLFVVCPTRQAYPVDHHITVLPAIEIPRLRDRIEAL